MCLEDLRLARGRVVGKIQTLADLPLAQTLGGDDASRVAWVFSPTAAPSGSMISLSLDSGGVNVVFTCSDVTGLTQIMRIEDLGRIINGTLFMIGSGAGQQWHITEILQTAKGDPIF